MVNAMKKSMWWPVAMLVVYCVAYGLLVYMLSGSMSANTNGVEHSRLYTAIVITIPWLVGIHQICDKVWVFYRYMKDVNERAKKMEKEVRSKCAK